MSVNKFDPIDWMILVLMIGVFTIAIIRVTKNSPVDFQDRDYLEYRFNMVENKLKRMKVELVIKESENGDCELYPIVSGK